MYTITSLWTYARAAADVTTVICDNRAYAILDGELQRSARRAMVLAPCAARPAPARPRLRGPGDRDGRARLPRHDGGGALRARPRARRARPHLVDAVLQPEELPPANSSLVLVPGLLRRRPSEQPQTAALARSRTSSSGCRGLDRADGPCGAHWRTDGRARRARPTPSTTGPRRRPACTAPRRSVPAPARPGLWAGTVVVEPGARTGAHHHGELESVIYVVSGRARMRWGDRLEFTAEAGPGDFIYVPPHVPHQELNASTSEPLHCVVTRTGLEPVVVELDLDGRRRRPRARGLGRPSHVTGACLRRSAARRR